MKRSAPIPRKQRTRQHVIADISVNFVERFVVEQGHTVRRVAHDYGYDLELVTYDDLGYVEPGLVYIQLKAAESLRGSRDDIVFDLDIRDYNLWMLEIVPVVLMLFDVGRRKAFWVHVQQYFRDNPTRRPKQGAKWTRIRVPIL